MKFFWSKNHKVIDSSPVSLTDDSGTLENTTFEGTLENTTYTDWSNNVHALSSDISYDYVMPEDDVSCTSIVEEFKILCISSADHHQSSYELDDVWRTLTSSKESGVDDGVQPNHLITVSSIYNNLKTIIHPMINENWYIAESDEDGPSSPQEEKIELILNEHDETHHTEKDEGLIQLQDVSPGMANAHTVTPGNVHPFVKSRMERLAWWSKLKSRIELILNERHRSEKDEGFEAVLVKLQDDSPNMDNVKVQPSVKSRLERRAWWSKVKLRRLFRRI